jgi:hypothetical protein
MDIGRGHGPRGRGLEACEELRPREEASHRVIGHHMRALPYGRVWERKDSMPSLGYHRLTFLSRVFSGRVVGRGVSVAWFSRIASRLQPPGAGANLPSEACCGSRKPIATTNCRVGACVITLLDAHSDDATHPLPGLPRSVQAPAAGPTTVQDNPYTALGECANGGNTGRTRPGAASDVARAGQSRGPGIHGEYSRSAVRRRGFVTDSGGRLPLL